MITVYKYTLQPSNTTILLPMGAEILTVAFQEEDFCVWVKLDTVIEQIFPRSFAAFGTGHNIPQSDGELYNFIGTAFMGNGLVFHVFEII